MHQGKGETVLLPQQSTTSKATWLSPFTKPSTVWSAALYSSVRVSSLCSLGPLLLRLPVPYSCQVARGGKCKRQGAMRPNKTPCMITKPVHCRPCRTTCWPHRSQRRRRRR